MQVLRDPQIRNHAFISYFLCCKEVKYNSRTLLSKKKKIITQCDVFFYKSGTGAVTLRNKAGEPGNE